MTGDGQKSLFGSAVSSPDVKNLPLILNPNNDIEVLAPGSVYQPLLLDQRNGEVFAGPGSLNPDEEQFVRHLISFLYPNGDAPKSPRSPLLWGDKQIWLKRNIEKDPTSFRLRVDSSDWYYPDFVIWMVDAKTKTQTFGFADPKGLALGAHGGWSDHKIVCTQFVPHVLEKEIGSVKVDGEDWKFRIRGVLVSVSSFDGLKDQRKFFIRDQNSKDVRPSRQQFEQARIIFQERDAKEYIPQVLRMLESDNEIDRIFSIAVDALDGTGNSVPESEIEADVLLRLEDGLSISDFVASIMQDYLVTDGANEIGARARQERSDLVARLLSKSENSEFERRWNSWADKDSPSRFLFANKEIWKPEKTK